MASKTVSINQQQHHQAGRGGAQQLCPLEGQLAASGTADRSGAGTAQVGVIITVTAAGTLAGVEVSTGTPRRRAGIPRPPPASPRGGSDGWLADQALVLTTVLELIEPPAPGTRWGLGIRAVSSKIGTERAKSVAALTTTVAGSLDVVGAGGSRVVGAARQLQQ
jgi:hypothetical protein